MGGKQKATPLQLENGKRVIGSVQYASTVQSVCSAPDDGTVQCAVPIRDAQHCTVACSSTHLSGHRAGWRLGKPLFQR